MHRSEKKNRNGMFNCFNYVAHRTDASATVPCAVSHAWLAAWAARARHPSRVPAKRQAPTIRRSEIAAEHMPAVAWSVEGSAL